MNLPQIKHTKMNKETRLLDTYDFRGSTFTVLLWYNCKEIEIEMELEEYFDMHDGGIQEVSFIGLVEETETQVIEYVLFGTWIHGVDEVDGVECEGEIITTNKPSKK